MIDLTRQPHDRQLGAWAGVNDINRPAGISEHLCRGFEQVGISRLALFVPFSIQYGKHSAFGNPGMVMKTGNLNAIVIPAAVHQPGQHAYGIPQKIRVGGMMDVSLNAGAVNAHLSAFFDFFLLT